jgi:putative transposase
MTYIRTTAGWRYLAVWTDLCSRRVIGWAMGAIMELALVLEVRKISCSMSANGCCWDNAVVESFFSILTRELNLYVNADFLNSPQPLIRHLAFWIDVCYNRERRHSTIGDLSPIDYDQLAINTRRLPTAEP